MLGIVGFLTGPLGKIATYAGIVLVVVGIAFGYLKLKEHEAVQQATIQYNIEQLQQVQKQNDAYKAQIDTLQQQADVLVKQNDDLNKAVDTQKDEIDSFILTAPKVVVPPASLMVCTVPALPDKFNTNKDVASLLNKVYNSNVKCKNNMDGIKSFFVSARKTIH